MRLAALLTCHNRKATTLASLESLFQQRLASEVTVFLVDDGSTDGTSEAVRGKFPQVQIQRGDGSLFWCGGMRVGFDAALRLDFDFYLWLNDDTHLAQDAVAHLLETYELMRAEGHDAAIIVGSTRDPQTDTLTYGGVVRSSRFHPLKYRLLPPGDRPLQCHTMNGNCVLIPRAVVARAHSLSPEFRHGIGDFDYGLRARSAGCTIWITPGFVGTCPPNPASGGFQDSQVALKSRWRHMMGLKGLPPREYLVYARRHGGLVWPIFWAMPYVRIILDCLRGLVALSRRHRVVPAS
jgi:GT2 family glycosyltransferase